MTHAITLDNLHNLSDEALWAQFDETQALLEELPCGGWERGIALSKCWMALTSSPMAMARSTSALYAGTVSPGVLAA